MKFTPTWLNHDVADIPSFQELEDITGSAYDEQGVYIGPKEKPDMQLVMDQRTNRQFWAPKDYDEDEIKYGIAKTQKDFNSKEWWGMVQDPHLSFGQKISTAWIEAVKTAGKSLAKAGPELMAGATGAVDAFGIDVGNLLRATSPAYLASTVARKGVKSAAKDYVDLFKSIKTPKGKMGETAAYWQATAQNFSDTLDKYLPDVDENVRAHSTLVAIGGIAGQVGSSLLLAAGVNQVGGLKAVASVFGTQQFYQLREEYLQKGYSLDSANIWAALGGGIEGAWEAAGFSGLLKYATLKPSLRNVLISGLIESLQEGAQTASEEFITNVLTDVREETLAQVLANISISMAAGFVPGAGFSLAARGMNIAHEKAEHDLETALDNSPIKPQPQNKQAPKEGQVIRGTTPKEELELAKANKGSNDIYEMVKNIANAYGITEDAKIDALYYYARNQRIQGKAAAQILEGLNKQLVAYNDLLKKGLPDKEEQAAAKDISYHLSEEAAQKFHDENVKAMRQSGVEEAKAHVLAKQQTRIFNWLSDLFGFDLQLFKPVEITTAYYPGKEDAQEAPKKEAELAEAPFQSRSLSADEEIKGLQKQIEQLDKLANKKPRTTLLSTLRKTGVDYKNTRLDPQKLKDLHIKNVSVSKGGLGGEAVEYLVRHGFMQDHAQLDQTTYADEMERAGQADEMLEQAVSGEDVYRLDDQEMIAQAEQAAGYREELQRELDSKLAEKGNRGYIAIGETLNRIVLGEYADATTLQHELMHHWKNIIEVLAAKGNKKAIALKGQMDAIIEKHKGETKQLENREEEVLSEAFEKWLYLGGHGNTAGEISLFKQIQQFFKEVYESAQAVTGIRMDPEIDRFFRQITGLEPVHIEQQREQAWQEGATGVAYQGKNNAPLDLTKEFNNVKSLSPEDRAEAVEKALNALIGEAIDTASKPLQIQVVKDNRAHIKNTNLKLNARKKKKHQAALLGLKKIINKAIRIDKEGKVDTSHNTGKKTLAHKAKVEKYVYFDSNISIDGKPYFVRLAAEQVKGQDKNLLDLYNVHVQKGSSPDVHLSTPQGASTNSIVNEPEIVKAQKMFQEGIKYDKNGKADTNSPEFKKWFGNSKVVDEQGRPLVVYHGSTRNFEIFDINKANPESDLGKGFYFSDNENDVTANYEGGGPDFENKVDRIAERIQDDEGLEWEEAKAKAYKQEYETDAVYPVYLKMETPFVLGGQDETVLTFEEAYNEETDEYGEPEGTLLDFAYYMDNYLADLGIDYKISPELFMRAADNGGEISASEIYEIIKADENLLSLLDYESSWGELLSNAVAQTYDGIIDHTVDQKFGTTRKMGQSMSGMDPDTTHYVVFEPTQIKSVYNRGTFDGKNPNIYYQIGGEKAKTAATDKLEQAKKMLDEGKDNEAIWQKTGWFKGPDGKWRFEISDKDAKLKIDIKPFDAEDVYDLETNYRKLFAENKDGGFLYDPHGKEAAGFREKYNSIMARHGVKNTTMRLGAILSHDKLFQAYPYLEHNLVRLGVNETSHYRDDGGGDGFIFINIADFRTPEKIKEALLHEIQHAIQAQENFAKGGSPADFVDFERRKELKEELAELKEREKSGEDVSDLINDVELELDENDAEGYEAFNKYKALYGEIEARNVEGRSRLTEATKSMLSPEATQDIKSADAIIAFDDGTELSYRPQEKIFYQPGYHGSANKFDSFDHKFIGTGEGAQAHGWGTYIAGKQDTAEGYRYNLIKHEASPIGVVAMDFYHNNLNYFMKGDKYYSSPTIDKNTDTAKELTKEEYREAYLSAVEEDRAARERDNQKGQVYEVEIPESNVLLDEQKKINKQPAKVRNGIIAAMEEAGLHKFVSAAKRGLFTGGEVYDMITSEMEGFNQKDTSLLLLKHGIKGITYDGRQDGRCYVIFDANDVKIMRTFYQNPNERAFQYGLFKAEELGEKAADSRPSKEQIAKDVAAIRRNEIERTKTTEGFWGSVGNFFKDTVLSVRQRAGAVDPKLKALFDKLDFFEINYEKKFATVSKAFIRKFRALDAADRAELDYYIYNRCDEELHEFVKAHDMEKEYKDVRNMLNDLYELGNMYGIDMNFMHEYYPTLMQDYKGFVSYMMQTDKWTYIEKALAELDPKNMMTDEEKAIYINKLLRGHTPDLAKKPAAAKAREILYKDPHIMQFYAPADEALKHYVSSMSKAIATHQAFGMGPKGQMQLEESIGGIVQELIKSRTITPQEEELIKKLLRARLTNQPTPAWVRWVKNVGYLTMMNNITNAITQLGDFYAAFYKYGFAIGLKATFSKSEITTKDLGIDDVWEEFGDEKGTAKAIKHLFKAIGLEKFDKLGKHTAIQGSWLNLQKQAAEDSTELMARLARAFGKDAGRVLADIKAGNITDEVKLLVFCDLADTQPIGRSGVPVHYLNHPVARLFYQLKTFTLNQLSLAYYDGIVNIERGIKYGDMKQFTYGSKKLFALLTLLTLFGAGADTIKNILMGREIDIPDALISNLLWQVGFSKYTFYKGKREGYAAALFLNYLPPQASLGDDIYKDIRQMAQGKKLPKDSALWTYAPFGRTYFWWFGGGSPAGKERTEKMKKAAAKRTRKQKKSK